MMTLPATLPAPSSRPARLLVPLPPCEGGPSARCPVCGAGSVSDDHHGRYTCGAGWPDDGVSSPCPAPPARVVIALLRAWFRKQELWQAAAFLRRHAARTTPTPRAHHTPPAWLLPQGTRHAPPVTCPVCDDTVAAVEPGRWHYRCGMLMLELPGTPDQRAPAWRACLPCQRPPMDKVVEALAAMPDCPLNIRDLHQLRHLVAEVCWI